MLLQLGSVKMRRVAKNWWTDYTHNKHQACNISEGMILQLTTDDYTDRL